MNRSESLIGYRPNVLDRKLGRRSFLTKSAKGAVIALAGGALGAVGLKAITDEYRGKGSYFGHEVKGTRGELVVISPLPDRPEVPVREGPSQGEEEIGQAMIDGDLIQARVQYGATYAGLRGLGNIEGPDGRVYGKWFKLQSVRLIDKEGVQKEVHGKFVAGNFVRVATDEEKAKFIGSRE